MKLLISTSIAERGEKSKNLLLPSLFDLHNARESLSMRNPTALCNSVIQKVND